MSPEVTLRLDRKKAFDLDRDLDTARSRVQRGWGGMSAAERQAALDGLRSIAAQAKALRGAPAKVAKAIRADRSGRLKTLSDEVVYKGGVVEMTARRLAETYGPLIKQDGGTAAPPAGAPAGAWSVPGSSGPDSVPPTQSEPPPASTWPTSWLREALGELDGEDGDDIEAKRLERMAQRQKADDRRKGLPLDTATKPVRPRAPRRPLPTSLVGYPHRTPKPRTKEEMRLIKETRDRGIQAEADGESGWDVARRQLDGAGARPPASPHAPARSGARVSPAALAATVSAARKRIRAATMPAFAAAIDAAVSPALLVRFVRTKPAPADFARLRHAYVATAARHFAADFVRTIGSAPKGTSENLALGAIIATALAQTGRDFPIVPAPAVPAMSVLIHKTLTPRLADLARMAAVVAIAPAAARAAAASASPAAEMAW